MWHELDEANRLIAEGHRLRVHDVQLAAHTWLWPCRAFAWLVWRTSLGAPVAWLLGRRGVTDPHGRLLVRFTIEKDAERRPNDRAD